jgi:cell division protein FtsW
VNSGTAKNLWQGFVARSFHAQSIYFYFLLGITALIVVFGLVMVLSSSSIDSLVANNDAYYVFIHQLGFVVPSLIATVFISWLPLTVVKKSVKATVFVGLLLQLLVVWTPLGISVNGNRAWLRVVPGISLQPSEFLKVAMILGIAWALSQKPPNHYAGASYLIEPFAYMIAIDLLVVGFGRDLGTGIVISLIALLMMYFAGAYWVHLKRPLLFLGIGGIALLFMGSSRIQRIQAWLSPDMSDSANDFAWQSIHGIWALAAGGASGVGLGLSKMKWSWIPEVENDYIFSIIGEELGMAGAILTIALFAALVVVLFRIYQRCDEPFTQLVTLGVMIWISVQTVINIGVVLKVFPVLGVPLPLISQGGSSVLAALGAIGIVLSIERDNHQRLGHSSRPARRTNTKAGVR